MPRLSVALSLLLLAAGAVAGDGWHILLPEHRLAPAALGVVVNDDDPLSVRIADYYLRARGIPRRNLVHVRFRPASKLSPDVFRRVRAEALRQAHPGIQAWALTWALPYRVSCMSITSAFSFGFDRGWCSASQCAPTRRSPLFNADTPRPFSDLGVRPAMAIAATDFASARRLIDRGIAADGSDPDGTAWLVSTPDRARNVRAAGYAQVARQFRGWLKVGVVEADAIRDRDDVLFYFTGRVQVPGLDTLRFLPGAIADHLTSAGGVLDGTAQMSSLRWLEAGATGSYGTVVEPCNLPGKFPNPGLVMEHYTHGRTLLESYWAGVQQPGEGLFIGEPLAAPFDGQRLEDDGQRLILHTRVLRAGRYRLEYADAPPGPYRAWPRVLRVRYHQRALVLPRLPGRYYRLRRLSPASH
ncbi:MAG TPA: TIGR03790 family protein [Gammaproteobacteria bacterium]|nr:TIGR03790 family protein [Gammaproteobacteria bacterium]